VALASEKRRLDAATALTSSGLLHHGCRYRR
jgi:hypothetical protein